MQKKRRGSARQWKDRDDAPALTTDFFERAEISEGGTVVRPASGTWTRGPGRPKAARRKEAVSLRLDTDVLAHFRDGGPGWQTRINETLRKAARLKSP
jgi:uncharacterized protein (DUF4415 family)